MGNNRRLDQRMSVPRVVQNTWSEGCENLLRAGLHDDEQGIKDVAKRRFAGESKVIGWVEEHVDCRRCRPTAAVSQHNDQLQIIAQVLDHIMQDAQDFRAEAVAGHAEDKTIVWSVSEDQFGRHPGVRTADDRCKWALFRELFRARQETQVAWIDRDDPLNTAGLIRKILEERRKCAITIVKPVQCSLAVGRAWPRVCILRSVTVRDVDGLHTMKRDCQLKLFWQQ